MSLQASPPDTSARSSMTYTEVKAAGSESTHVGAPFEQSAFTTSIENKVERMQAYGGDDVQEPSSTNEPPSLHSPNFVSWDGPDDPSNPKNWSTRYKWFVTAMGIVMAINVTFSSSAPTAATTDLIRHFHISLEVSSLVTSTFLLGYVFGPLFWGPGSEVLGRRPIVVGTLTAYTLFILGQPLAKNIETLLVTRFFSGFFAVGPLTVVGGLIADVWAASGIGLATSLFSASVFLGPVLGPLVGGFVASSSLPWYWIYWIMMMFATVCTVIVAIFLPETYAPVLLLRKTQRLRKEDPIGNKGIKAEHEDADWSFKGLVHRTIYRPFIMLSMEPILTLITIYLAIVYGVLYGTFQSLPLIFTRTHGFTLQQNGLICIGVGIGASCGAVINFFATRHYPALIPKWRGFPPPEQRLFGAMIGAPALVVAAFWLGWTGQYANIPWYVPAIATIILGLGISTIFMSFLSYLVDTYLMYSASAFAANTIVRSAVAAAFPLFTVQMYDKLGINWATTFWGLIALVFAPSPFLFYKYGPRIRSHSRFAPCLDLKLAEELAREEKAAQEKV